MGLLDIRSIVAFFPFLLSAHVLSILSHAVIRIAEGNFAEINDVVIKTMDE